MTTAAGRLARFVLDLKLEAVPAPIVAAAADLVLDALGNALAAARDDFGVAILGVAQALGGPAESSLLGAPGKVSAANAVLANATLAHGLDFDDTREDAIVHTSCVAVTTALAVAEATGAPGRAVLEAAIAAVEVMCRVGLVVPGALHARHFHPTAITGELRRGRGGRQAPRPLGGAAHARLRHLREPGVRDHRVPRGRIVDEAAPSRMERARRRRRGAARSGRIHGAGDGLRRRPRPLSGVRGRPRPGEARGGADEPRPRRGRSASSR